MITHDPNVVFLPDIDGAQWIIKDSPFQLKEHGAGVKIVSFRHQFENTKTLTNVHLSLMALRNFKVYLDGNQIVENEGTTGKKLYQIPLSKVIETGKHELLINISNLNGPPLFCAFSDLLSVESPANWEASISGDTWEPTRSATTLVQPEISQQYGTVLQNIPGTLPPLIIIFIIFFTLSYQFGYPAPQENTYLPKFHSAHLRWCIIILSIVMGMNNIFKIPLYIGFDSYAHMEYVAYLLNNKTIPLANEGWQMFQPPLYYILTAGLYKILSPIVTEKNIIYLMRIIPLLCSILQIEIVYRTAKNIFPKRDDLIQIGLLIGGFIPANIYISQFVGNEPLAGVFMALTISMCLTLIMKGEEKIPNRFYLLLGLVWGLAMLTKMTALLLGPPIVLSIVFTHHKSKKLLDLGTRRLFVVCAIFSLIAGWYYIRNIFVFGHPLVGGWEARGDLVWWQEPGYRTWSQILSFGYSFNYPIYAGTMSLLDSLYSGLWLDGFVSGVISYAYRPPWNDAFLSAGAWLGLVPSLLIILGGLMGIKSIFHNESKAIIFCVITLIIFFAAITDLFMRLPIYSTAKATYTIGALPCYAILAAHGAHYLSSNKWIRSTMHAMLACWALSAYTAFFVVV